MMKGSRLAVLLILGVLALASGAWIGWAQGGPTVEPPSRLSARMAIPQVQVVLDPPGEDYRPAVSAERALTLAAQYEDIDGASRIRRVLALFTNNAAVPVDPVTDKPIGPPIWLKVPAWIVIVDGVCIPIIGGFTDGEALHETSSCAGTQAYIVLDARTGEFLEEFSFQ